MSEAELAETLSGYATVCMNFISLWVTLTFAYLSAAYFVGSNLSRFQATVVSGLYVISALWFGLGAVAYNMAWQKTRALGGTVFDEIALTGGQSLWIGGVALFVSLGTSISLYFMYDVRKGSEA